MGVAVSGLARKQARAPMSVVVGAASRTSAAIASDCSYFELVDGRPVATRGRSKVFQDLADDHWKGRPDDPAAPISPSRCAVRVPVLLGPASADQLILLAPLNVRDGTSLWDAKVV
jgi:hypothetical protein